MATVDQIKDDERLRKFIIRNSLVSLMNDTKWKEFQSLMMNVENKFPSWRARCLRDMPEVQLGWESDFHHHFPEYRAIEWLDIQPKHTESQGALLPDKVTDYTSYFVELFKTNNISFSMEGPYLRIWGYKWPNKQITFV